MINIFNAVTLSHYLIDLHLEKGATAVDATCGNGNDTLYLCEKVGKDGFVYAFDIQEEACRTTSALLRRKGVTNAKVICKPHETMDEHVIRRIACAVFNLGFLPSSDSKIRTEPETTILAIEKAMELLIPDGFIIISVYVSHEGGKKEYKKLLKMLDKIDAKTYQTLHIDQPNRKNIAPKVLFIRKKLIFN